MISLEKLLIEFKKKYYSVFATTIGSDLYVWRPLTRSEYEIISKSAGPNELLKEEMICQAAVLYPEVNFGIHKAGVPSSLAPQIIEESGFGTALKTYEYLSKSRDAVLNNFTAQAEIVIAAAFPQYTFEEMKSWNIEQLLDMVARAEWKLNVLDRKDFVFQAVNEEEENEEETKSPKEQLHELEQHIIQNGGDPILMLGEHYKKQVHKEYVEFPFIMGKNWDNEVVVNVIQQQLKGLSE